MPASHLNLGSDFLLHLVVWARLCLDLDNGPKLDSTRKPHIQNRRNYGVLMRGVFFCLFLFLWMYVLFLFSFFFFTFLLSLLVLGLAKFSFFHLPCFWIFFLLLYFSFFFPFNFFPFNFSFLKLHNFFHFFGLLKNFITHHCFLLSLPYLIFIFLLPEEILCTPFPLLLISKFKVSKSFFCIFPFSSPLSLTV